MKIVSACLAGINCRYDGKSSPVEEVMNLVRKGEAIPVCPEQFGGLPTPRICCEIKNGMVFTKAGDDVSSEFKKGAEQGLKIALLAGMRFSHTKGKVTFLWLRKNLRRLLFRETH